MPPPYVATAEGEGHGPARLSRSSRSSTGPQSPIHTNTILQATPLPPPLSAVGGPRGKSPVMEGPPSSGTSGSGASPPQPRPAAEKGKERWSDARVVKHGEASVNHQPTNLWLMHSFIQSSARHPNSRPKRCPCPPHRQRPRQRRRGGGLHDHSALGHRHHPGSVRF